ncbi:MAG: nitrous oxide reductase accessory protein NosL [Lewinellaceae bacterium]|nr:nitrous oxide reductase accessory protein NosL [Lewinellaceae bacterium]
MKIRTILYWMPFLLVACSTGPKPIDYGSDKCDFCKMTIVDVHHAAEVVTTKGKVFKFDAIECMVNYVGEHGPESFGSFWINDYPSTSGELVDATSCTFLVSPNIPSPMGAFLSGFLNSDDAKAIQQEKSGELYDWKSLLDKSF